MTSTVTTIFLCFFIFKLILVFYLDYRNQRHINLNQFIVPGFFDDVISLDDHQKAARYSLTKIKAGYLFSLLNFLIVLFWTLGGGLNLIQYNISQFHLNDLLTGTIFFLVLGFIGVLLQLPESIYSTFKIEARFGFNKTTPKIFATDLLKELLISLVIGIPVIATVLYLMIQAYSTWWLYAWIFITAIKLFMIFIYPTWIAPLFNKFTPLDSPELVEKINHLLQAANFYSKEILVMDASKRSKHGNAYFTGLGKSKRVVFYDTLLTNLTNNEIIAILAHELGHFKHKHVLKHIVTDTVFTLLGLYILGQVYHSPIFYEGHGVSEIKPWLGIALFIMVTPIYTFLITPIMSFISRSHEFEADNFARKYANNLDLVSALKKLYRDNAGNLTPDPLYSKFYYSHPPAIERIQNLTE